MAVRFLLNPLPPPPWPLITRRLPAPYGAGSEWGFPRFPLCPVWRLPDRKGLGTLYPPEVIRERCAVDDKRILTSCLLAAAPPLQERQALAA